MNEYRQIRKADNWKDQAAGWAKWRVRIPECVECGTKDTSYTIHGTEGDVKELASKPEMNTCDKCS